MTNIVLVDIASVGQIRVHFFRYFYHLFVALTVGEVMINLQVQSGYFHIIFQYSLSHIKKSYVL